MISFAILDDNAMLFLFLRLDSCLIIDSILSV
jgi:hypothetical protein